MIYAYSHPRVITCDFSHNNYAYYSAKFAAVLDVDNLDVRVFVLDAINEAIATVDTGSARLVMNDVYHILERLVHAIEIIQHSAYLFPKNVPPCMNASIVRGLLLDWNVILYDISRISSCF
jgi:hypothetical protein